MKRQHLMEWLAGIALGLMISAGVYFSITDPVDYRLDDPACRPHEPNELVQITLVDGHINCETHKKLLYGQGLMCPVKGGCDGI